jgi:hypothetical protein
MLTFMRLRLANQRYPTSDEDYLRMLDELYHGTKGFRLPERKA